ncbi:MAG: DUF4114 domain-containing protein, partial [Deltaproteobacteria bacterium]|nr:DUF4114 domain-containing protein [Deltaproteobacteria bacterium]
MRLSSSGGRRPRLALPLALTLVTAPALAVVIQINGTTVPTESGTCPGAADKCLQTGLNVGEGFAANATNNPLDAQFSAATIPELFTVPRTAGGQFRTVTFYSLQHGAGYDNAFGWYNAGTPGTRYQVFDGAEKANNSAPTLSISQTLDFEALCNPNGSGVCQGNYKGGAIGFYLRVPDDGNRVYFTEKELNADGNYVHFLVYASRVDIDAQSGQPLSYYFGFEDLYRGGDNDFDDSAYKVNGLIVPCVRQAEICDGKDNDCDGLVDDVDYTALGPCYPPGYPAPNRGVGICQGGTWACTVSGNVYQDSCQGATFPSASDFCDGLDNDCDGQTDEGGVNPATQIADVCPADALAGECDASLVCLTGTVACQVNVGPTDEVCDGKDNDCDGQTDEVGGMVDTGLNCACSGQVDRNLNRIPSGQPCAGPTGGECSPGQTVCTTGQLSCQGYVGPTSEICDGKDNDCDGAFDEGLGSLGSCNPPTPTGVFVCNAGQNQCLNGVVVCTGYTLGSPELCNGRDDDCDGTVDDSPLDVGLDCGTTLGICQPGTTKCENGAPVCRDIPQGPLTEVCDGVDNDCDGRIDELPLAGVGQNCQTTPGCRGTRACVAGSLVCNVTSGTTEICDGIDNDCDGETDEDPADVGGLCSTALTAQVGTTGACELGRWVCDLAAGARRCDGEIGPTPESCNGADDDCDGFVDEDPDGTGPEVLSGTSGGRTVSVGEACGGDDAGTSGCLAGAFTCRDGAMVCDTASTVRVEVCNGIDDDCDGAIDEHSDAEPLPSVGAACGSAFPPCQPGTLACVDGELKCQNETVGTEETCDGVDNDCDGIVDDPPPAGFSFDGDECYADGVTLPLSDRSLCRAGKLRCYEGAPKCIGAVGPFKQERCNGIDDTCDGEIDEGVECPSGLRCFEGACRKPCRDTEFSSCPGGQTCLGGFCIPDEPSGTGGATGAGGSGAGGSGAGGSGAGGSG